MRISSICMLSIGLLLGNQASAEELTVQLARENAVLHHPRLAEAQFTADAAERRRAEFQSLYYPVVTAFGTAADAHDGLARIAAGSLNSPSVFDRLSFGIQVSQLLTDFGQSEELNAGATQRMLAERQLVAATRQELVFSVDQAFFGLQEATALCKVAAASVQARRLVAKRAGLLAKNHQKSELDAGSADVQLVQGQLLVTEAENAIADRTVDLRNLTSLPITAGTILIDPPPSSGIPASATALIALANQANPQLLHLAAERQEQLNLARAAIDQANPRISLVGAAGTTPFHDSRLTDQYAAAGVNLTVPLFNGFAYSAQRDEALDRAKALDAELRDYALKLEADIRTALNQQHYLGQEIAMYTQLSTQTQRSYQLAEERYRAGTTSMVELGQAQLDLTQAQIDLGKAIFAYRLQEARLSYDTGTEEPRSGPGR